MMVGSLGCYISNYFIRKWGMLMIIFNFLKLCRQQLQLGLNLIISCLTMSITSILDQITLCMLSQVPLTTKILQKTWRKSGLNLVGWSYERFCFYALVYNQKVKSLKNDLIANWIGIHQTSFTVFEFYII